MSNKRRKTQLPRISCSWIGCTVQCGNDWEINGHIETHLESFKPDDSGEYNCVWGACEFTTECVNEIHRHLYYHGYYNGLLVQGKYELETNPTIPRCNAVPRECDKIPELKTNFRCEWTDCARTFISIIEFQDHIVQHASFEYEIQKSPDDERPKIQCNWNFCSKQMDNKYRLIEHIRTHSNKKQVACYHCGELFRTKTTLFDHLRRQPENNTQKYQCAQCFKYFATEKLLRSHMLRHVNCFKCSMCDMTCSSASALATHVRYRHLKDKPFKCVECDYRCVRESDLNQHVQLVHSQEVHRCEEPGCTYAVKTFQALRRIFPVFFILMNKKTYAAYAHLLNYINDNIFQMEPNTFITDYEQAMRTAVQKQFPQVKLVGCWFHYCQALRRYVAKNRILLQYIRTTKSAMKEYKKLMALPLLPPSLICAAFQDHYFEVHKNTTFIYICHFCDKPFKTGKTLSMHLTKKHDIQLPSGHRRFTYRIDENGYYRLETTRIESLEVTEQILTPNSFELSEVTDDNNYYEIVSMRNKQDDDRIMVSHDDGEIRPAGEVLISLPSLE